MALLRAAFESAEGDLIQLTVLCTGCYNEVIERTTTQRYWCRELTSGRCEFCQAEVREAALNG